MSEYINKDELSDVTFIIEGKKFYAHRWFYHCSGKLYCSKLKLICDFIDKFKVMFTNGMKESKMNELELPI